MPINLRKLASERERLHENHASSRPLSKDYEYIGLKGEEKFAEEFSMEIDEKLRPEGDGGRDFPSHIGIVDVKTARKAYNLIVEEGKVMSDIYVLAKYIDDTDKAELLGWAYKHEVLDAPVRDFGYGIINHYIPKQELKHMKKLKDIILNKGETMSNKIIMAIAELEDGREHIHAKHNKPLKYNLGSISDLQVLDNYSKHFIKDQSMCYSKDLTRMYSTKGTPENERTMVKSMRYEPYDETLHIPYRTFGVFQETEKGENNGNSN